MIDEESYTVEARSQQMESNVGLDKRAGTKAIFNKHFPISNEIEYALPDPQSMFDAQPWQLDCLQELKSDLNKVKSRLNDFYLDEWHRHTRQMNRAGSVSYYVRRHAQPEFITQAWCKFYEIVCNFPLVPIDEISRDERGAFTSVHLCEAPGAFVVALNHWLKSNARHLRWEWIASTLNPYCEENPYNQMIEDDRFIRHTLKHWCFGADNTGNLMNLRNLDALVERASIVGEESPVMLVTADGSIDCVDTPGEQESTVAHLHLCETIACMHLLRRGGNFLLKVFTLFEQQSVCLMYLLSCAFQRVIVTKPATSKAGNSETYVVCINFKGKDYVAPYLNVLRRQYDARPTRAMFDHGNIPDPFVRTIEDCSRFFMRHQCEVIDDNVSAFESSSYNKLLLELNESKRHVAVTYLKNYNLKRIDPIDEIVGRNIIERSNNCILTRKTCHDSYNERCQKQDLDSQERLRQIRNEAQELQLSTKRSYTWIVQSLPQTLEIQTGRPFNRIRSSRFCESNILRILNEMQEMHLIAIFPPPIEIVEKLPQQFSPNDEILNCQFARVYDSHQTIVEIYDRLKTLQTKQTLILIGYPLLSQLNVGLLYILGNSFNKTTINIHDNGNCYIKLETYQQNENVLNHFHKILAASYDARKENMAIWSVIPMTVLYEWDQYSVIIQVNHLMVKLCSEYVFSTIDKALQHSIYHYK